MQTIVVASTFQHKRHFMTGLRYICYMFSLDQLASLTAVVEEGTISAAADRLGYTPSAVSQQLSRLERDAGTPLMSRQGRYVVPTDSGLALVEAARVMISAEERARAELERLTDTITGRLAVAAFASATRGLVADALATMKRRHASVSVSLREHGPDDSLRAVERSEVDVAVGHDWVDDTAAVPTGVVLTQLGTDPLDVVLPLDHTLASETLIRPRQLTEEPWISDASAGTCQRWLHRFQQVNDVQLDITALADEHHTQIALIRAGLGVTMVPRLGRGVLPEGVVAVPVVDAPTRRVFVAHRADSSRRPTINALIEVLVERAAVVLEAPRAQKRR
jgi:DNA-binding transcriptional LysR family regulator